MTDDATEWVTVKVPKTVRDDARDDPRTYGDIMADGLGTDSPDGVEVPVKPTLDDDAMDEIIQELNEVPSPTDPIDVDDLVTRIVDEIGAGVGGPQVDDSEIAREVAAQLDYVDLAEKTAEKVVGELR